MIRLDTDITLFLNSFHSCYWDDVFYVFSGQILWIPFFFTVIYVLWTTYGRNFYIPLLFLVLAVAMSDQISSSVIKPIVCRLRPSHATEISSIIHIVHDYRGGLYGFVSSHAANSFAFAMLSSLFFNSRYYSVLVFVWALLTSYSRIYLGVHYFGDVVCGASVGIISAYLLYKLYVFLNRRFFHLDIGRITSKSVILLYSVMLLTIIALLLFAEKMIVIA